MVHTFSSCSTQPLREGKPFNPLLGETYEWQSQDGAVKWARVVWGEQGSGMGGGAVKWVRGQGIRREDASGEGRRQGKGSTGALGTDLAEGVRATPTVPHQSTVLTCVLHPYCHRYLCEQVSHHPPVSAYHAHGGGPSGKPWEVQVSEGAGLLRGEGNLTGRYR